MERNSDCSEGEKKRDNISDRLEFSTVASEREACPPLVSYFTPLATATSITDSAFFWGGNYDWAEEGMKMFANGEEKMSWPISDWVFSSESHLKCSRTFLFIDFWVKAWKAAHTMASFGDVHVDN